jgi:flagellar protein FliO/FliZ
MRGALSVAYSLFPAASFAADHLFAAPSQNTGAPSSGIATAGQMTLALALVLAAVFVAAWLMRRLRGFGQRNAKAIQVIADVSLGGKERAVLLQVGETKLLVGVAPGHVNALHVLGKDELVNESAPTSLQLAAGTESGSGTNELPATFKAILKRSLGVK